MSEKCWAHPHTTTKGTKDTSIIKMMEAVIRDFAIFIGQLPTCPKIN